MSGGPRKSKVSLSPASFERAALFYLERYASSAGNLRRVLQRRIIRAERDGPVDRATASRTIEEVIARLRRAAILDDGRYARGRAATLFRQGKAKGRIAATLARQGVDGAVIEATMQALAADHPEADRTAAAAYARRRRLGPWRPAATREAYRKKDMAALARQGFSLTIVRDIIGGEADEV